MSDEAEVTYTIRAESGALVALRRPDARFTLAPSYKDAFTNAQLPLVLFRRDPKTGQVNGMSLGLGRVRDLRLQETRETIGATLASSPGRPRRPRTCGSRCGVHDPLRGQHGAQREAAPGARAVLEQDLVAAGVEADGVLAHDPAGAHRGRRGTRSSASAPSNVGDAPSCAAAGAASRIPASARAVPEGASFFCRWCFSRT